MRRTTRRSLRRAWQIATWPLSGHIALALATGLVCWTLVSRYLDISAAAPAYAALLGALVVYPAMVAAWWRLNPTGGR